MREPHEPAQEVRIDQEGHSICRQYQSADTEEYDVTVSHVKKLSAPTWAELQSQGSAA